MVCNDLLKKNSDHNIKLFFILYSFITAIDLVNPNIVVILNLAKLSWGLILGNMLKKG